MVSILEKSLLFWTVLIVGSWRQVLADDPTHARPIVSSLLKGRVTITPNRRAKAA